MSAPTALRRVAALGVAAVALAAVTAIGPQSAAADAASSCAIGMVPLTNQETWVRSAAGFTFIIYTLPPGAGFRIVGGPMSADGLVWYYGHGNGMTEGWVPGQNLTCW